MTDDLLRIILRPAACLFGVMDRIVGDIGKLGHVIADIGRGVELLGLRKRGHDAREHIAVHASTCDPLPVDRVIAVIGIDQTVPIPFLPLAPVDQQMLDQEAGANHPHPVVQPSMLPQLPHAGIDDRITSASMAPAVKLVADR